MTTAPSPPTLRLRRLAPAVAAGLLSATCGVGLLSTSGWLITRAFERPPVFALSVAIGAVQAFALGRGIARYGERLGVHGLALARLSAIRLRLYDALEPLVPGGLGGHATGAVVSGFVADAESAAEGFSKGLTAAIDVSASVLAGVVVAGIVEPRLALLVLVAAAAVVVAALVSARATRRVAVAQAADRAALADVVVDTVRAAPELVAYGRADLLESGLGEVRRRSLSAAWRGSLAVGLGRATGVLLSGAGLIAVVAVGLGLHDSSRVSGVMLAVATFGALAVFDQLGGLAGALGDVENGKGATGRLAALATAPPPAPEPVTDASPPPGELTAALADASVSFGGARGIENVSFTVSAGRRIALSGANGAGKTTALHALLHFVDTRSGRATIGGVSVATMQRAGIARHVSWMADDTPLFAWSLADNLRLARDDATDAELVAVLGRVGLGAWFAGLDEGLGTRLGSGGRPVSAGERQRLGLARALLARGSVLLLDEPTAHLDPAFGPDVLAGLLDASGDRAVVVVSHDPGVERLVDEVITLEGGRVVDRRPGGRDDR